MYTFDILTKAREELATRGLAKGILMDEDGRVCARGALLVAVDPTTTYESVGLADDAWASIMPADNLLSQVVWMRDPQAEGWRSAAMVDFNNRPETTLEDVLGVFDEAIGRAA